MSNRQTLLDELRAMRDEEVERRASDDPDAPTATEAGHLRRLPLVKRVRRGLRLSQQEFADRYGLPVRSLQQWEQGRREPPEATRSYLLGIE